MKVNRVRAVGATVGLVAVATFVPTAQASPPAGLTPTTLATASLNRPVYAHGNGVRLRTLRPTDIRVQQIVFAKGSSSGWHHHPGLVTVVVATGSVTVWDNKCRAKRYGPDLPRGAAFIESGNEPGLVTSRDGATNYVTYIVPKVDPAVFRIEDDPPACAS